MSKSTSNMKFANDNIFKGSGMQFDLTTGQLISETPTLYSDTEIIENFQDLDFQDALARYRHYNLPSGLDGNMIERILYYRYKGIFLYIPEIDKVFFLPYTLGEKDGITGIDVYGRYQVATPLPFNGKSDPDDFKGMEKQKALLSTQTRHILRSLDEYFRLLDKGMTPYEIMCNYCVELKDYPNKIAQQELTRYQLQRPYCVMMADAIRFANTAALNKTGVIGVRVQSPDEQKQVWALANTSREAALHGKNYIPVMGNTDFQNLGDKASSDVQAQLNYLQAIDIQRLKNYGLKTQNMDVKTAYMNKTEVSASLATAVSNAYDKGLELRQEAYNLVNALFGTHSYALPNENCIEQDLNGDGALFSDKDQSGQADNASTTTVDGGDSNE